MEPRREDVLAALERVIDPELGRPVTELDMVRDVRIEGGDVAVTISPAARFARASRARCATPSVRSPAWPAFRLRSTS